MSTTDTRHTPTAEEFIAAQASPEFQELRSKRRSFTFPITIAALLWFVAYIILAMFAPDLYATEVWGNINLGLILGLLQFLTTFLITYAYVKYADKELEPRAEDIRNRLEKTGPYSDSKTA
ncbi:DUF485 domain-containing protein [Corynebacterium terpenotabidum]|uniref:DUF485 domain-containing protein n=1 Tax=Corynebacterium terpenotabidum Y-11 TaxID=1200352 RepID=S4XCJ3_9CORY|nr:DUF485 domain-containing protein [Corynebacterium terpenotabidum]AGP30229.1 hypothetical protein A606_02880 [Corynebacterium terpenotabidum Y-11]